MEARDDKQLLRFQKKLATYKLLIVDELGHLAVRQNNTLGPTGRPGGIGDPATIAIVHIDDPIGCA